MLIRPGAKDHAVKCSFEYSNRKIFNVFFRAHFCVQTVILPQMSPVPQIAVTEKLWNGLFDDSKEEIVDF